MLFEKNEGKDVAKQMGKISVINVAGELDEAYITGLETEGHTIQQLDYHDHEPVHPAQSDIVIIYEEDQEQIGELCQLILQIKEETQAPVWLFSKECHATHHLIYLEFGVERYLDTHCTPLELRYLIRNTTATMDSFRRAAKGTYRTDWQLNDQNQSLMLQGKPELSLTVLEYRLMSLLFSNPGTAFEYHELYEEMWPNGAENEQGERTRVANIIFRLRLKLKAENENPNAIKTVRSKGYKLEFNKE